MNSVSGTFLHHIIQVTCVHNQLMMHIRKRVLIVYSVNNPLGYILLNEIHMHIFLICRRSSHTFFNLITIWCHLLFVYWHLFISFCVSSLLFIMQPFEIWNKRGKIKKSVIFFFLYYYSLKYDENGLLKARLLRVPMCGWLPRRKSTDLEFM